MKTTLVGHSVELESKETVVAGDLVPKILGLIDLMATGVAEDIPKRVATQRARRIAKYMMASFERSVFVA
jgi:hypothetical protein